MKLKTNIGSVIFDSISIIIGLAGIIVLIFLEAPLGYSILIAIVSLFLLVIGLIELRKEFK